MPFTPSHAVVALPFIRTPLVPAAIAVGAMTPDLPLFVRGLPLHYGRTHDLLWVPVTVLLALVLLIVWRCILRPAVRELSPTWLAQRLPDEWDQSARDALRELFGISGASDSGPRPRSSMHRILLLVVSLLLGVLTHIAWDAFTHEGRWGTMLVTGLGEHWGPLAGYKWLQHGSSLLALVVLGIAGAVWLARRGSAAVPRVFAPAVRVIWWASLPIVLIAAWVGGLLTGGPLDADFTIAHLAYRVLPPACAVWGIGTVCLAAATQLRRARMRSRQPDAVVPRSEPLE